MKHRHIDSAVSILLLFSLCVTGLLGFIQSELELRRFVPHRYAAYTTLCLAALHIYLKGSEFWRYIWRMFRPERN